MDVETGQYGAGAEKKALKAFSDKLRAEPTDTLWWLVPSTEWPAYRFGKLFFEALNSGQDSSAALFCGFSLEKGLSGPAVQFYPSTLIMDPRWIWPRFLSCAAQDFPNVPKTIRLVVAASYINPSRAREITTPESFLAQKRTFTPNRASFALTEGGELSNTEFKSNENNPGIAQFFRSNLNHARNIPALIAQLQELPQQDWVWIDLFVGPVIGFNESLTNPDRLWRIHLRQWLPWLT